MPCRATSGSQLANEGGYRSLAGRKEILLASSKQPLHVVSLYSIDQFPADDRGGNSIPLRRGRNLHSLWDGLLGRRDVLGDVDREVAQLSDRHRFGDVWDAATKETDSSNWADESRETVMCGNLAFISIDELLGYIFALVVNTSPRTNTRDHLERQRG